MLRGQGFLPRFILTIPENLAGTRLQSADKQAINTNLDHRLTAYWYRCEYLLDETPLPQSTEQGADGRYVMQMDNDAKQIDLAFYNEIERLQAKGERYEYLQAFASRASQLARRLATVFAYFEGLTQIDAKTLQGACDVIRHSLGEWARYAEIESKDQSNNEKLVKYLIARCKKDKTNQFKRIDIRRACPSSLRDKRIFEECVAELIELNHILLKTINCTEHLLVNPLLLK